MTRERVISLVTDHGWLVKATEWGSIWIRIGETEHLFSKHQITRLCRDLLEFAVDGSDISDPMPETGEKPIAQTPFVEYAGYAPETKLSDLGINLTKDAV
jgi:hypothetical protein